MGYGLECCVLMVTVASYHIQGVPRWAPGGTRHASQTFLVVLETVCDGGMGADDDVLLMLDGVMPLFPALRPALSHPPRPGG